MISIHVGYAPLKPASSSSSDFSKSLTVGRIGEIEMAQFSVNAQRFDPYKNLEFRVKWDGRYVAGVTKVGGFQTEHRSHRASRGRRPLDITEVTGPDQVEPIPSNTASQMTPSSRNGPKSVKPRIGLAAEVAVRDFSNDVIIELYNEAGQLVLAYSRQRLAIPIGRAGGLRSALPSRWLCRTRWLSVPMLGETPSGGLRLGSGHGCRAAILDAEPRVGGERPCRSTS
jgi:hypothetical protein